MTAFIINIGIYINMRIMNRRGKRTLSFTIKIKLLAGCCCAILKAPFYKLLLKNLRLNIKINTRQF